MIATSWILKKVDHLLAQRNKVLVTEKTVGEDGLWYSTYIWNNFYLTTWISETPKAAQENMIFYQFDICFSKCGRTVQKKN